MTFNQLTHSKHGVSRTQMSSHQSIWRLYPRYRDEFDLCQVVNALTGALLQRHRRRPRWRIRAIGVLSDMQRRRAAVG
jgi:hypothetical protein